MARSIQQLVNAYPAYEAELKKNNIPHEGHICPNSVHGFFNDATPERYNKVTAPQAWSRTIEWFNKYTRVAGPKSKNIRPSPSLGKADFIFSNGLLAANRGGIKSPAQAPGFVFS